MIVFKDIDEASPKPECASKTIARDAKANAELPLTPEATIEAEREPETKTPRPRGRAKGKAAKE